jgi:hypothetical protein
MEVAAEQEDYAAAQAAKAMQVVTRQRYSNADLIAVIPSVF